MRLDDHTKALHDAGCSDGLDPDDVAADDEGLVLEAARLLSSTRPFAMTFALHAVGSQGAQHSMHPPCSLQRALLQCLRLIVHKKVLLEATRSGVAALALFVAWRKLL